MRRLRGGLGTSTHVVTLQRRSARSFEVVLKRYRENDADADREWRRTVYAHGLPVPSPEPIAFDATGAWFGAPAVVLSKLPGRPELWFRSNPDSSYEHMAEAMLTISSAPTGRLPSSLRDPVPGRTFTVPEGLRRSPLVDDAMEAIRFLLPRARRDDLVMSHGDFHPGNLLWSRGRLTGIVDWGSSRLAYRTREVVYCRTELAVLFGSREADRFLEIYENAYGRRLPHVRVWDLMQGLTAMRWVPWWVHAYREQGRTDLTEAIGKRRAANVVRRALASG